MRNERHEKILELIAEYEIGTQEDLASILQSHGFPVTQATISRDIRALHLMKGPSGNGGYKYVMPKSAVSGTPARIGHAVADSIVRVDYAGNLVVLKTYPGMAQSAAAIVDSMNSYDIVGSVAGDDTVLVVVRNDERASVVASYIQDAVRSH